MMRFLSPEWLLFVPLLVFVGWRWRGLRLWRPLRVLCLILMLLFLVRMQVRYAGTAMDLWLLLDRSASANDLVEPQRSEWITLLERSKGSDDQLRVMDFAEEPVLQGESDQTGYPAGRDETRLGLALHHVLSQLSEDRANRVLVMTDGYPTEDMRDAAERLVAQQTPLDYRLLTGSEAGDVMVRSLSMPNQVQAQEPFLVEVKVTGTVDGPVPYEVFLHNKRVGAGEVEVSGGLGMVRFADRHAAAGAYPYRVQLNPLQDALPGNNRATRWIEVVGGPRLLLISGIANDPLASMLRQQGFSVDLITSPTDVHEGLLQGAKAVLFNQMPAYKMPTSFLKAIDFFVRVQGGGLLMAGGEMSFGSGGYYGSALDPLLPVSMELKEEHRKLATAMAIVMDRSGSMGMSVSPGMTKMDLANEGAARTIELLGQHDSITVFAVDSEAHPVIQLAQVGPARNDLIHAARSIQSGGGGIYVYTGMKAAWGELSKADVGQRHMILFSDAADSEEPGEYKQLLTEMVAQGTTVSVIGLGTPTDSDADFLKDIALRGNGRMFFNTNPVDLPALFAQEAVSVARSAFIEDPVPLEPTAGWMEIAAQNLDWLKQVDGYNLSYLRPEATAAALSGDEYAAPLIAFWHRGVGRVAAISFPLSGDFSQSVRAWKDGADMMQTLARWLMGENLPPGIGLRHELQGTSLHVDLMFDERWEEDLSRRAPALLVVQGESVESEERTWQRMAPGHFRSQLELRPQTLVRGAVHAGDVAIPFGPIAVGTSPEWTFDEARLGELRRLSVVSGGEERLELTDVWDAPRRSAFHDVRPWLAAALFVLFLLEALLARLGWAMPRLGSFKSQPKPRGKDIAPPVPHQPQPEDTKQVNDTVPVQPQEEPDRRARFRRAKRP